MEEVEPKQSEKLWHSLVPSLNRQFSIDCESEDKDVDNVLMNALDSRLNASVILERNETRLERNETHLERNDTRLARNETRSGNLHLSSTVKSAHSKTQTSI